MKIIRLIIHTIFYISCFIVVTPVWIDLFSDVGFEVGKWAFYFNVVMLCLVNMTNGYLLNPKVFKISIISLVVVSLSLVSISLTDASIIFKIAVTLIGISYFVMLYYFINLLYIHIKANTAITYNRKKKVDIS